MSYTVTQGDGSQIRTYDGLTPGEAIERAEALLAAGRRNVAIIGPNGPVDLDTLRRAIQGAGRGR